MAIFDLDDEQRNLLVGIGIGMGALALLKGVSPAFKGVGRPLAKATIKSGITAFEKSREKLAEFQETYEDLVAEVHAEMDEEMRQREAEAFSPEPPVKSEPEGGE
jgi:Protein of unknown function (DUF5132)